MTAIRRRAHAKLNPVLRVLGRRVDSFHDLETVVLPIELHDGIEIAPAPSLSIEVYGPLADELAAAGGDRVAGAAARALADACAAEGPGATIRIEKHVPVAAGLGGGSADAAATLLALRDLWGCPVDDAALARVAATIGSDVPALLEGGAVSCTGRGEIVVPIHAPTTHWVVRPFPFAIAAGEAYGWWDEDGGVTGPDTGVGIAAVEAGNVDVLGQALANDLEGPAVRRRPEIGDVIQAFLEAGALGAIMSGSGPTVVALARHLGHADRLAAAVEGSFVTSGPPRTMTP